MTNGPVVLLEGASDVAAVRAVADVLGVDDEHVRYVELGGVTNVRGRLEILRVDEPDTDVVGMCDAGEILARELASALNPETVPEPLRLLVERLR